MTKFFFFFKLKNKVTTSADSNKIILAVKIRRRTVEDPETLLRRKADLFNRSDYTPIPKQKLYDIVANLSSYKVTF